MPKIKYTDENKGGGNFVLTPGEHEVTFVDFQFGISSGPKTSGAEKVDVKLEAGDSKWVYDNIIFTESTAWKASAFLTCFGFVAPKDTEVDCNAELLATLVGMRGKIEVANEKYTDQNGNEKVRNKLKAYITPKASAAKQPTHAVQRVKVDEDLDIKEEDIPF